jgi:hypothetical protein
MLAKLLLAGSLLALATAANAQTHYDASPIPGAPPGFQRVVFTPVIDIANGYGKSGCYAYHPCTPTCYDYLFVQPCVDGKPCGFGHYTKSFGTFAGCPNGVPCGADTLDLTIGVQYSFYGNWIIQKHDQPIQCPFCPPCEETVCEYDEDYAMGTYPANTPTVPTRWGTLRVKYR